MNELGHPSTILIVDWLSLYHREKSTRRDLGTTHQPFALVCNQTIMIHGLPRAMQIIGQIGMAYYLSAVGGRQ